MPGSRTSMPNIAWPVHFACVSSRASGLPASVYWSGGLIAGSSATCTLAAAAASAPKPNARPLPACRTCPSLTLHALAGTPHCCAAAAINRTRALAPTCCIVACSERIDRLPPVPIEP